MFNFAISTTDLIGALLGVGSIVLAIFICVGLNALEERFKEYQAERKWEREKAPKIAHNLALKEKERMDGELQYAMWVYKRNLGISEEVAAKMRAAAESDAWTWYVNNINNSTTIMVSQYDGMSQSLVWGAEAEEDVVFFFDVLKATQAIDKDSLLILRSTKITSRKTFGLIIYNQKEYFKNIKKDQVIELDQDDLKELHIVF